MWEGTFVDTFLGGQMHVCVSQAPWGMVAQAVISNAGYMVGTLENNRWQGKYFLAGEEAARGHFDIMLNADGGGYQGKRMAAGQFGEVPFSGSRISAATPSDLDCFRSSPSMFTEDAGKHPWEGMFHGVVENWNINEHKGHDTFSSSYHYELDGQRVDGYERGSLHDEGRVGMSSFFEGGAARGVDLMVARDKDSFYSTYWAIPSMAAFDYSTKADADTYQGLNMRRMGKPQQVGQAQSEKHFCLMSEYNNERCVMHGDMEEGGGDGPQ